MCSWSLLHRDNWLVIDYHFGAIVVPTSILLSSFDLVILVSNTAPDPTHISRCKEINQKWKNWGPPGKYLLGVFIPRLRGRLSRGQFSRSLIFQEVDYLGGDFPRGDGAERALLSFFSREIVLSRSDLSGFEALRGCIHTSELMNVSDNRLKYVHRQIYLRNLWKFSRSTITLSSTVYTSFNVFSSC